MDGGNFTNSCGDERGVAAGGDDFHFTHHNFAADFGEDFPHEATVAIDGTGEHGVACGFTDGAGRFEQCDFWQERGALVEVVGHRFESGRDDAADVFFRSAQNVEGDCGAKIYDDAGRAVERGGAGCIGEAICADAARARVFDADAEFTAMRDGVEWKSVKALRNERAFFRNDAAHDDPRESPALQDAA